jgi:hypothetical protein
LVKYVVVAVVAVAEIVGSNLLGGLRMSQLVRLLYLNQKL